jgi:hypothetical protein
MLHLLLQGRAGSSRRTIVFVAMKSLCLTALWCAPAVWAWNARSGFHGASLVLSTGPAPASPSSGRCAWTMRKQKASDRRTRRRQRGDVEWHQEKDLRTSFAGTLTESPMQLAGAWSHRRSLMPRGDEPAAADWRGSSSVAVGSDRGAATSTLPGGRGRSRKRNSYYNSLASYHNKFLNLLTQEYQAEVRRIDSSRESSSLVAFFAGI